MKATSPQSSSGPVDQPPTGTELSTAAKFWIVTLGGALVGFIGVCIGDALDRQFHWDSPGEAIAFATVLYPPMVGLVLWAILRRDPWPGQATLSLLAAVLVWILDVFLVVFVGLRLGLVQVGPH